MMADALFVAPVTRAVADDLFVTLLLVATSGIAFFVLYQRDYMRAGRRSGHFLVELVLKGGATAPFLAAANVCLRSHASYGARLAAAAAPSLGGVVLGGEVLATSDMWLVLALAFSFLGDVLLIRWFVHGLIAFAVAHIFFIAAFVTVAGGPLNTDAMLRVASFVLPFTAWLNVFVFPKMRKDIPRVAVTVYSLIIAGMTITSVGACSGDHAVAAALFFLSDLGILRNLIAPSWVNRASVALYVGGQLIFAYSLSGRVLLVGGIC
jgi:uncharacterized membrane protein YhhN